jgi:uncharacterized protein
MTTITSITEHQQPIPPKPNPALFRIESLDVLRGIAVLGGLLVSIWVFGGFSNQQQNQALLQHHGWNHRAVVTMELLFNGKMRALIALVFGAAMILFLSKENDPGQRPSTDVFINRQILLIMFGLLNGLVLLWSQDILFHLGIMGIMLFPFVKLSRRTLLITAILITLIYCGKNYWNYADDKNTYNKYVLLTNLEKKFDADSTAKAKKGIVAKKDTLSKLQKEDKGAWEGRLASMKVDVKRDEPNIKAMREVNYGKTVNYLLQRTEWREAQWFYQTGIWDLAGMIFLGMFFYKTGFFNNIYSRNKYLLLGLGGIIAGLLLGVFRMHFQVIALEDYLKYIKAYSFPPTIFFPFERALLSIGYASLVIFFLSAGFLNKIWKAFAYVGRVALTNYLLQTIICTLFFNGYGMGYFARLSQFELYLFAGIVMIFQIAFSVFWVKNYNYGPAEWLVRRISYGKKLHRPFKNNDPSQTVTPVLS